MNYNIDLIFDRTELAYALSAVVKAVSSSSIETSDSYIYISADKDENAATIKAFNGVTMVRAKVRADVMTAGNACLVGRLFTETVLKITAGEVSLKVAEKQAVIGYDGGEIKIPALDGKDEPKFPTAKLAFKITPDKLKRLISVTQNFVSTGACINSSLEGAYIEAADGTVSITGCDGYHAAKAHCAAEVQAEVKVTIPLKSLKLINQIIGKSEEIVVGISENALIFKQGVIEISTSILNATYPINIDKIIPTTFLTEVTINRAKLIETVGRAMLFTDTDNKLFGFDITENELRAVAQNANGLISESLKAKTTGKDLEIYFNIKYLMDTLNALDDDEITLKFNRETQPMAVTVNDSQFVVLPIRRNKEVA